MIRERESVYIYIKMTILSIEEGSRRGRRRGRGGKSTVVVVIFMKVHL